MLRKIAAVVVPYIVMTVLIISVFMGMWFGMGPDRLLEPGTWKGGWFLCIAAPSITVLCGLFGGWMCIKIGRSRTPLLVLAGVVLVLGGLAAALTLQSPSRPAHASLA